ncbi:MAG: hypothetical protein V3R87_11090 [Dehalococcoidia bacterium]
MTGDLQMGFRHIRRAGADERQVSAVGPSMDMISSANKKVGHGEEKQHTRE